MIKKKQNKYSSVSLIKSVCLHIITLLIEIVVLCHARLPQTPHDVSDIILLFRTFRGGLIYVNNKYLYNIIPTYFSGVYNVLSQCVYYMFYYVYCVYLVIIKTL